MREVGADRVDLVTHSTTQAVNALLEGDVGTVGVIGLGRRPELKQARKRTQLDRIELSPGRFLRTVAEFLDVTDGLDEDAVREVLDRLTAGRGQRGQRGRGLRPRRRQQRAAGGRTGHRGRPARVRVQRADRACTAWSCGP